MDMSGEYRIPAPRQRVWDALNDPQILGQCIPGCESIEKTSDTEMTAVVTAKVGPVKAKFNGDVTLSDIDPPNGYTLAGEGKGGVAGFARGEAKINLSDDGDDTILTYAVEAKVGGKLAQVGARLVDGTARKMADDFFGTFSEIVAGEAGEIVPEPEKPASEAGAKEAAREAAKEAAKAGQDTPADITIEKPKKNWASPMTIGLIIVIVALVAYALYG